MRRWLAVAFVGVIVGCAGDEDTRPATLAYLLPAVFAPNCATASCHAGDEPPGLGLAFDDRDPARLRDELVERTLVFPFQPEGSPLLNWLRGVNVPERMPPDQPLSEADIRLVEEWIAAGAP